MNFKPIKVVSNGTFCDTFVMVGDQNIGGVTKIEVKPLDVDNQIFKLVLEFEDFEMDMNCHPFKQEEKA